MLVKWLLYAMLYLSADFSLISEIEASAGDLIPCQKGWFFFRDKCYKLGGKKNSAMVKFDNASANCIKEGGRLATIQSKELNDVTRRNIAPLLLIDNSTKYLLMLLDEDCTGCYFILTFLILDAKTNAYIGLHDRVNERKYTWMDVSVVNFTKWEPHEPSGPDNEEEDCVEIVFRSLRPGGKPGDWNDVRCTYDKAYICEADKNNRITKTPDPRFCSDGRGGWKYQNSCYYFVNEKKNWENAEQHCMDIFGGHLVTITDFTVDLYLDYMLSNFNREVWIGIKIQEQLQQRWTSGWYVSYSDWSKDKEDFVDGTCVLRADKKLWRISPCSNNYSFICEKSNDIIPVLKSPPKGDVCPDPPDVWRDLGGNFCYFFDLTARFNWYQANFECLRRGGSLLSIHSIEESNILHAFVRYKEYTYHIGLHRTLAKEDGFVWSDGSQLDFKNWGDNEPNRDHENCVEMMTTTMRWNDVICINKRGYICSARKVSSNVTQKRDTEIDCQSKGVTLNTLIGVSVCILLVVILLGVVVYCYRPCVNQQRKRSTVGHAPVLPTSQRPMYRSPEIIIKEDDYMYENMQ